MRFRPTAELCYLAGLAGRTHEPENSQVGIVTQNEEIEQRFIEYALKLGVDPTKIMVVEEDSFKHIYFYHSKLAKMIREVLKERATLASKRGGLAAAFIAGTFDAGGHMIRNMVTIRRMERADELLLERMGIHSVNSKILNIREFFSLIKDQSILSAGAKLGA
jgi:hypothetical protein